MRRNKRSVLFDLKSYKSSNYRQHLVKIDYFLHHHSLTSLATRILHSDEFRADALAHKRIYYLRGRIYWRETIVGIFKRTCQLFAAGFWVPRYGMGPAHTTKFPMKYKWNKFS